MAKAILSLLGIIGGFLLWKFVLQRLLQRFQTWRDTENTRKIIEDTQEKKKKLQGQIDDLNKKQEEFLKDNGL